MPSSCVSRRRSSFIVKNDVTETYKRNWNILRDIRRPLQKQRALELMSNAGLTIIPTQFNCGFPETEKFQSYHKRWDIAIVVYDKETLGSGEPSFFDGRFLMRTTVNVSVINILYDPVPHFDTIMNLTGTAQCKFFCSYCNMRYHFVDDQCKTLCSICMILPVCEKQGVAIVKYSDCLRNFFGNEFYNNHERNESHKVENKKICSILKNCINVSINIYKGKLECGVQCCKFCQERYFFNDFRYLCPVKDDKEKGNKFIPVLFFETR